MPTNRNALIRYMTIDTCIRNTTVACTRERLQKACSAALDKYTGREYPVSERTIYDDLKVMREGQLGFKAPIAHKRGVYYYTDPDFSISIFQNTDLKLLEDIINFLIRNKDVLPTEEADELINRIAEIVGHPIPRDDNKKVIDVQFINYQRFLNFYYFQSFFYKKPSGH